ncbi:DUF4349 domain-containing protein [Patescibacteria group bacterium]|nr:DUF4349 domain-containing protein [Patescibacteria group bacterium]
MISKIFNWVKTHKLLTFNILVFLPLFLFIVFIFVVRTLLVGSSRMSTGGYGGSEGIGFNAPITGSVSRAPSFSLDALDTYKSSESISNQVAQEDRKVITNSNLSLLVTNVDDVVDNIRQRTIGMGGFMVNTNIRRDAEASSATIEVRVPSDQLVEFSKYLRTLAVKVVYENINGRDITDQYTDYEERLASLESVKERLETIMEEAETVDEILNVQNRIFNIQNQIDSIKGQLTYMDRSTTTSKVTITISTDELSLPYTPVKSWRPDVISKRAIRSLISVVRAIGTVGIWTLFFLPLVLFFITIKITIKYLFRNRKNR